MPYFDFLWTEEMLAHLAENGLSRQDFEFVVCNPEQTARSRSSGRPLAAARLPDGRYVVAVYDLDDDKVTVLPVTAYEVERPI